MSFGKPLRLSPSSLNLYRECPRCFWLQINRDLKRPEQPVSTLPMGIDLTLKAYFDHSRRKRMTPPLLEGKLPGKLVENEALIARFRSRSFEWYDSDSQAHLGGLLDEALEMTNGTIVPLDNKTRGFPPLETHAAHSLQMSIYTLLLRENKIPTKNVACLIYWFFNHKSFDMEKPLRFNSTVEEIKTDPDSALALFREAVKILRSDLPPAASGCEFCLYRRQKE